MLIYTETYIYDAESLELADKLGMQDPEVELAPLVVVLEHVTSYAPSNDGAQPGTLLFINGEEVAIAMPYKNFDDIFSHWYYDAR